MLRISKLSDYSLIIIAELNTSNVLSASFISGKTSIPLATTNKILKLLTNSKICISKHGKNGGFVLLKSHSEISIYDVIVSIDEKPALTECSTSHSDCHLNKKFISDLIS